MISKYIKDKFYKCEDYFYRSISQECREFGERGTAYFTGIDNAYLNPLFLRENQDPFEKILKEAQKFYTNHMCPWCVIILEHLTSEKHLKILSTFNFFLKETSVVMAIDLKESVKFECFKKCHIKFMSDTLNEWMIPLIGAFGTAEELTRRYSETHIHARSKKANFYHFTMYQENQPVSSLTLSITQKGACLNDVGTRPEFQKKGFASTLILFALSEAQKLGAMYCFLDASTAGFSLYKRLGFTPLFKNNIFLKLD